MRAQATDGARVGRHRRPATNESPADGRAFSRDHQTARMRAKLMNPATGFRQLIEGLNAAHQLAGAPPLDMLGDAVGYQPDTLSEVLAGRAMPPWVLVVRLGEQFGVPAPAVTDWYTLWTAAKLHRPGS
jgi:hypothetical protein